METADIKIYKMHKTKEDKHARYIAIIDGDTYYIFQKNDLKYSYSDRLGVNYLGTDFSTLRKSIRKEIRYLDAPVEVREKIMQIVNDKVIKELTKK